MGDLTFGQRITLPGDPTSAMHAATKQYVDGAVSATPGAFPAGTITPFAGSTAPSGWLLCYGQAVSRTTYAALYSAIGVAYGSGDGSTTFNLPDLRGRVPAGVDNMGGSDAARLDWANTLGTNGGAQTHTLQTSEMPAHDHPASLGGSAGGDGSGLAWASTSTTNAIAIQNTGGGGAHNNMQPTILLNYVICTGMYASDRNLFGTAGPEGVAADVGTVYRQTAANSSHGNLNGLLWNKVGTGTAEGTDWLVDYEGRWVSYTPSTSNVTLGSGGTITGKFTRSGKQATVRVRLVLGTSGSFSGTIGLGLPAPGASLADSAYVGHVLMRDSGVSANWGIATVGNNATDFGIVYAGTGSAIADVVANGAKPFTWGNADNLHAQLTYELA